MPLQSQVLQKLKKHLDAISELKKFSALSLEFKQWHSSVLADIEQACGSDSQLHKEFQAIPFDTKADNSLHPPAEYKRVFLKGLDEAAIVLQSAVEQTKQNASPVQGQSKEHHEIIEQILSRFHLVAKQLTSRHNTRNTLVIQDEYDVQDLLHSLLHLYFDDIRPEEYTPSYAGGASRMDFLLKEASIVIEAKKTRNGLETKEIGEQLAVDILRYKAHPNCKCLYCFVYDPEERINNPRGIENDLTQLFDDLKVRVVISPKR